MKNHSDSKGKSIKWTLLNQVISFPLNFIFNIISKRLLGSIAPLLTGATVYFNSFQQYIDISLLPVVSGMSRNIPYFLELNDSERLNETVNIAAFLSLIILIISIITNILLFHFADNVYLRVLFLIGIIATPVKIVGRFINVYLGGHKKFTTQAKLNIFATFISICLGLVLIILFFDWGYIIAISIINVLPWLFLFFLFDFGIINFKKIFKSFFKSIFVFLKSSFSIFIISIADVILFTMDKIILKHKVGLSELGYYGFAFQIHNTIFTLVGVVFGTLFPFLIGSLVVNQLNKKKKYYEILITSKRISTIVVFFIICTWLFVSFLIDFVIPAFKPSKNLLYFSLFASYFYSIQYPFYVNLLASKKDNVIIIISLIYIILGLLLFFMPYPIKKILMIFTFIVILMYFIKGILIIIFSLRELNLSYLQIFKTILYILITFLPLILYSIILNNNFFPSEIYNYLLGFTFSLILYLIIVLNENRERKFYIYQIRKLYMKLL